MQLKTEYTFPLLSMCSNLFLIYRTITCNITSETRKEKKRMIIDFPSFSLLELRRDFQCCRHRITIYPASSLCYDWCGAGCKNGTFFRHNQTDDLFSSLATCFIPYIGCWENWRGRLGVDPSHLASDVTDQSNHARYPGLAIICP